MGSRSLDPSAFPVGSHWVNYLLLWFTANVAFNWLIAVRWLLGLPEPQALTLILVNALGNHEGTKGTFLDAFHLQQLDPRWRGRIGKTPASSGVILFQTVKEEIKLPLFAARIIGGVEIARSVVPTSRDAEEKGERFQVSVFKRDTEVSCPLG